MVPWDHRLVSDREVETQSISIGGFAIPSAEQARAVLRNYKSISHLFKHQTDAASCAGIKKRIMNKAYPY